MRNTLLKVLFDLKQSVDLTDWLDWFLDCLGRAVDNAQSILNNVHYKTRLWDRVNLTPVNERQRAVLTTMLDDFKGHMNTSKYAKLAKTSNDRVKRPQSSTCPWPISP